MHASLMAQQILAVVLAEADLRKARRVRSIDVEVGTLDGVREEELREALVAEGAGTVLEDAVLNIRYHDRRGLVIRSVSLVLGDD